MLFSKCTWFSSKKIVFQKVLYGRQHSYLIFTWRLQILAFKPSRSSSRESDASKKQHMPTRWTRSTTVTVKTFNKTRLWRRIWLLTVRTSVPFDLMSLICFKVWLTRWFAVVAVLSLATFSRGSSTEWINAQNRRMKVRGIFFSVRKSIKIWSWELNFSCRGVSYTPTIILHPVNIHRANNVNFSYGTVSPIPRLMPDISIIIFPRYKLNFGKRWATVGYCSET